MAAITKPALYALLIGINEYHPKSGVTPLDGCVNDVKAMNSFLRKHYKDLIPSRGIKKLLNEKATRENIIKAFQSQLINKAEPGDTVLLYYAGHGSFNESSEIFKQFDGKEQDETFVCYDSRLEGHYDLADKEIAVLLSRINPEVDIVVIADSCHSGSITRDVVKPPLKTRFYRGRKGERALNSYLLKKDNPYEEMLNTTGELSIPNARHLLLSGCDRGEESLETFDQSGLFTTTLLKELTENQDISYSHLFESVRAEVLADSDGEQQPTLNAWEGFNPNAVFLRKNTQPNTRHLIEFKEGKWTMAYGAIYGLPSHPDKAEKITIGVYKGQGPTVRFMEQVKVEKVNLGTTILGGTQELEVGEKYWGEIQNFPSALTVNLQGSADSIAAFNEHFKKTPTVFVRLRKDATTAKYTLTLTADKMTITAKESGKIVNSAKAINQDNVAKIKEGLEHIAKWETTATLKNEEAILEDDVAVAFKIRNDKGKWESLDNTNITLNLKDDGNGQSIPVAYQIEANNIGDEPLFVTLLHLSADFGINAYFQSQILEKESGWKILDTGKGFFIERSDGNQVTDVFKVIISNKRFDERKFLLPKLPASRKVMRMEDFNKHLSAEAKEYWFAHTFTVNLQWEESKIGDKKIALSKQKITVEQHEKFEADISFGVATKKATRSVHGQPWSKLQQRLAQNGGTLVSLGKKSRSTAPVNNIIELSNIKNQEALQENPLALNIQQDLTDAETIIPVTFDGEFIIPVGTSEKLADGSVDLKINHLPTYEDTNRAKKSRSLGRAAWFGLLKLARFDDDAYFKLRKVYYKKGKAKRTRLRKSHVRNADKILLVIHGIIGDTKGMIKNLEFLEDTKKYDLILTFDYENLNTKIEDIAAALNERLEKIGLGTNDGKTFDILAHSMGGLVSRYMIEYIRKGDDLVDNLFMFGTPNGGSVFGDIPAFRDKLTAILTIGLNYGKLWLGTIGIALDYFNKFLIGTRPLTVTLAQMSTEGDFIDKLVNSEVKVQTKYTVVAGDITDYQSLDDAFFTKLMDAILLKIGNVANDEANDIAVMVEDIRAVPESIGALKYDACCHHMNYFEEGEGLRILKEIMG